jgi:hypothetical protein
MGTGASQCAAFRSARSINETSTRGNEANYGDVADSRTGESPGSAKGSGASVSASEGESTGENAAFSNPGKVSRACQGPCEGDGSGAYGKISSVGESPRKGSCESFGKSD